MLASRIICILFVTLCLCGVNSMYLKGPPITRYDPCGLGMIQFEKIKDKVWQGVLNLNIFNTNGINTNGIDIQINFEKRMALFEVTKNSTLTVENNERDFNIKIPSNIPVLYVFYLAVLGEGGNNVPIVKRFLINNHTLCDDTIKNSQNVSKFNVTKANDTKYRHICGRRSLNHTELTSVRTNARSGDWPWHVAIVVKELVTNIDRYQCGGNIISTTAVLTAGHCVSKNGINVDPWRITILAGISNLTNLNQLGRQVHNAVQVILHPAFSDNQATADLAIIKVTSFRFTEYVQPVCIWGPVYDKSSLFGKEAIIVGFGTTEDNKLSDTLRSAYTIVQNDFTCIAYSPKLYSSLLNEFTFCAGYGPYSNINPRNGDSGGGLVVATVQSDLAISWFLRGIVSKCGVSPGHTQCDPKFYVVYTDVAPHYGWIYHNAGLQYSSNILH